MKAYLSRRYHFPASHRLHSDAYDAERNREVFGKCNNPHGHGHNYTVQVTVSGEVDAATGMVCNLAANLNSLECFRESVSTTENLSKEIYRIFRGFTAAQLERVHVEETGNNSFDYAGGTDPGFI